MNFNNVFINILNFFDCYNYYNSYNFIKNKDKDKDKDNDNYKDKYGFVLNDNLPIIDENDILLQSKKDNINFFDNDNLSYTQLYYTSR